MTKMALHGAEMLREEAGTVAVCMHCDRRAARPSDERKLEFHNCAAAIETVIPQLVEMALASRPDPSSGCKGIGSVTMLEGEVRYRECCSRCGGSGVVLVACPGTIDAAMDQPSSPEGV